jgi:hypothetical protein
MLTISAHVSTVITRKQAEGFGWPFERLRGLVDWFGRLGLSTSERLMRELVAESLTFARCNRCGLLYGVDYTKEVQPKHGHVGPAAWHLENDTLIPGVPVCPVVQRGKAQ